MYCDWKQLQTEKALCIPIQIATGYLIYKQSEF